MAVQLYIVAVVVLINYHGRKIGIFIYAHHKTSHCMRCSSDHCFPIIIFEPQKMNYLWFDDDDQMLQVMPSCPPHPLHKEDKNLL
jgi:hypothetical protein